VQTSWRAAANPRGRKIAGALRPIAHSATVVDRDMTTVLQEGSADWICVPTPPDTPEPGSDVWRPDHDSVIQGGHAGETPTVDRIGISYMLMGEVGADFDHPADQPPEGKDWCEADSWS
jgi:hypothetical protein